MRPKNNHYYCRYWVFSLLLLSQIRSIRTSADAPWLFGGETDDDSDSCSALQEGRQQKRQQQQCLIDEEGKGKGHYQNVLSNFARFPGRNQHLLLVPRRASATDDDILNDNTDGILRLTQEVTDRLRLSQSIHNADADDLMQKPPWERRNYYNGDEQQAAGDKNASSLLTSVVNLNREENKEKFVVPLELQSHPGRYIVPLSKTPNEAGFMMLNLENYVPLGIGASAKAALKVVLQPAEKTMVSATDIYGRPKSGLSYVLATLNGMILAVGADIMEGAPVTGMSLVSSSSSAAAASIGTHDLIDLYSDEHVKFVVHGDGSLSPVSRSDLVIGIAPVPSVHLVTRNSSDRLLFANARQFFGSSKKQQSSEEKGVSLELASHPGLAVVTTTRRPYASSGIVSLQGLGIGPAQDALHLYPLDNRRHHEFTLMNQPERGNNGTAVLMSMNLLLDLGAPVLLLGYNAEKINAQVVTSVLRDLMTTSKNATWIINEEGSISPLNAPYLALGCEQVSSISQTDELITQEQRFLAQAQWEKHNASSSDGDDDDALSTESLRLIHAAIVLLFVHGAKRHVAFLGALLVLILLKIIPWQLLLVGLVGLCFGRTAAMLCLAGQILEKVFRWWKPKLRQQQQQQRVDQPRG